ncbi:MAG: hypothetical protein MHPSP_003982 [Paramarteilia canceri]
MSPLLPDIYNSLELYKMQSSDDINVFVNAHTLAALICFAESKHALYFNVDIVGNKQIHLYLNDENYLNYAQIASNSPDLLAAVDKANAGQAFNLNQEINKLNLSLQKVLFNDTKVENFNIQNKFKIGSHLKVQVLGFSNGKVNQEPVHLRTSLEFPSFFQDKIEWKTDFESKSTSIYLQESRMNRYQMLVWHISAYLSGVSQIGIAYVCRTSLTDDSQHSVLKVDLHDVEPYIKTQMCYNLQTKWEAVKNILKKVLKTASNELEPSKEKLMIYYDPNRDSEETNLRLYKVPLNSDENEDSDYSSDQSANSQDEEL